MFDRIPFDRIPPQNINAEQIVLGTMLKDSRCVEMCMASLAVKEVQKYE